MVYLTINSHFNRAKLSKCRPSVALLTTTIRALSEHQTDVLRDVGQDSAPMISPKLDFQAMFEDTGEEVRYVCYNPYYIYIHFYIPFWMVKHHHIFINVVNPLKKQFPKSP